MPPAFLPPEPPLPAIPGVDLIRPLARGSHAQVWLACQPATGQLLAAKLLPLARGLNRRFAVQMTEGLDRLRAMGVTPHAHLLHVLATHQTSDWHISLMEPADHVDGRPAFAAPDYQPLTLESRIAAGALTPEQCLSYARQLLAGLAALHGARLAHRDVKPANCVFVGGRLKLADFSLMETGDRTHFSARRREMGPVPFFRADTCGVGQVVFAMLTALPPSALPAWRAAPIPSDAPPNVQALHRLIRRATSADRFDDAGAMLAALT